MNRLSAIQSLIVPANIIADVGCDHGLIAEYAVKSGLAKKVIASDISKKCLDKAKKKLSGIHNAEFIVCDGIDYTCDEAIIAGMGGVVICDILDRAKTKNILPKTLILMPHRDAEAVRRKLIELGFELEKDFMIEDRGKFYSVIRAVKADKALELTDLQYAFGAFYTERNETLTKYLERLKTVYNKASLRNAEKLEMVNKALMA